MGILLKKSTLLPCSSWNATKNFKRIISVQQDWLGASWAPSGFAEKVIQIPPGQHLEGKSGACPRGEGSCLQTGLSQHRRSWHVQQWPPAWGRLDHRVHKEMPRELGLFSFKRRRKEKLGVVFYGLIGRQKENRAGIFWEVTGSGRRSNADTSCNTWKSE